MASSGGNRHLCLPRIVRRPPSVLVVYYAFRYTPSSAPPLLKKKKIGAEEFRRMLPGFFVHPGLCSAPPNTTAIDRLIRCNQPFWWVCRWIQLFYVDNDPGNTFMEFAFEGIRQSDRWLMMSSSCTAMRTAKALCYYLRSSAIIPKRRLPVDWGMLMSSGSANKDEMPQ